MLILSVRPVRISCLSESWTIWTKCQTQSKHLPLSPSAQCLSLALAPAPGEAKPRTAHHPRTIPWPAPPLLLGQH